MTLGDLLARLSEPGLCERAVVAGGDLPLMARVSAAAAAAEMPLGDYVARSVRSFADRADDEAWLGLIGRCQNDSDPGLAALAFMLEKGLSAEPRPK